MPAVLEPAADLSAAAAADHSAALLGFAIWSLGALKTAPLLPLNQNLQTLAGSIATLLVAVAWPAWHPRSYLRWRTAALGGLRVFIFMLPVNYNPATFDGLVPGPATSRAAWVANASHLLMGTHVGLLVFCALLFRLPLRAHLRVQTACVLLLLLFGVHTHCQSKLFASPITQRWVALLHEMMGTMIALFAPVSLHVGLTTGQYAQSAAALIFLWLLLGLLAPTLLLIVPSHSAQRARQPARAAEQWQHQQVLQQQEQAGQGPTPSKLTVASLVSGLEAAVADAVRLLLPGQQLAGVGRRSASAFCGMSWLVAVCCMWLASCGLARLYDVQGGS